MKNNYEMVMGYKGLPVRILVHSVNEMDTHWHDNMELLLVLKGSVEIMVMGELYNIEENDIFIINSKEIHSISKKTDENLLLLVQFDVKFYSRYHYKFNEVMFKNDYFIKKENKKETQILKKHIANMVWSINKKKKGHRFIIGSEALRILYCLMECLECVQQNEEIDNNRDEKLLKFKEVLKYIDKNFTHKVTLGDLSNEFFFSNAHISRFFKEMMGVSFQQYLNYIRIDKASDLLLSTNKTITEIALESGLSSTKALNEIFTRHLGCTPSELRENYEQIGDNMEKFLDEQNVKSNSYFDVYRTYVFKNLFEELDLLDYRERNLESLEELDGNRKNVSLSIDKKGEPFGDYWRKLTTIGRAAEGLRADVQAHLTELQSDIEFEYIRFQGIFSEDMMICNLNRDGKIEYNWNYVDKLVDFLLSVNLKPFLSLGFMPEELKSSDNTMFWSNVNISQPKDITLWKDLVMEFVKHCMNRYGLEEVESWYFEVWNEPEIEGMFWVGTKEEYFEFYKETVLSIKSISKKLKVGGPSITAMAITQGDWMDEFLRYIDKNNLPLDHLSIHIYPERYELEEVVATFKMMAEIKNGKNDLTDFAEIYEMKENARAIYLGKDNSFNTLDIAGDKVDKYLKEKLEIHVTEWNASSREGNLIHDTCFVSNFIIDNILRCRDKTSSMGYWVATDVMEEIKSIKKEFHGGFGLMTNNGIKKPSYFAYFMLKKLGDEIIHKGDEHIITRKNDDIQILSYNYAYFDDLFISGDNSALSEKSRDMVYEEKEANVLKINMEDLHGYYKVTKYKLDKENGSAFDNWIRMGAPDEMGVDEIEYLKSVSKPKMTVEYLELDGSYKDRIYTQVHGVDLVILEKKIK